MQINFEAKKLKEANEYVDLLNPHKELKASKNSQKKQNSLLQKILNFLFK